MGLDMYLTAKKYIGGWNHSKDEEKSEYAKLLKMAGLDKTPCEHAPTGGISVNCAYWRKANAIHQWFVNNVQDGRDECQDADVTTDELKELVALCYRVLETKDATDLPPQEGFFFGSTVIGDDYFADLRDTIRQIETALATFDDSDWSFEYHSSW